MIDIYEYYQNMQSKNIVLAYKGNVSEEMFNSLLQTAESKLGKIELRSRLRKKVFNILVEILQNIYHHYDANEGENQELTSILFLLNKNETEYQIITGNHIHHSKVAELKAKIDSINSLSEEELKSVYRQTLYKGGVSNKGGAGLGIIDIARRSGEKINYNFKKINENYSFFSLEVKISA
ncbi:MAG TPA: SiaB family protein kinase [Cytophagales bacterium]|nr:SiaB family protein kinase [Cytophagales bacterium]